MQSMVPEQMKFIFTNEMGVVIPGLFVSCIIIAKVKNNYSIGQFISDEGGEIVITKGLIENRINREMMDFPMDYNCQLHDCTHLEILVETLEEIESRKTILDNYYPDQASLIEHMAVGCSNGNTHVDRLFPLPIKEIKIVIEIKHV